MPPLNRSDKAKQGVLKLILDGSKMNHYVMFLDGLVGCVVTTKAKEALHVRCNSLSNSTLLERTVGV